MTLDEAVYEAQREYCRRVLAETGGSVAHAAERAGRDRKAFYRLLYKFGLLSHRVGTPPRLRERAGWRSFVTQPVNVE
jgi:DNA-binding NtrC family response regulator